MLLVALVAVYGPAAAPLRQLDAYLVQLLGLEPGSQAGQPNAMSVFPTAFAFAGVGVLGAGALLGLPLRKLIRIAIVSMIGTLAVAAFGAVVSGTAVILSQPLLILASALGLSVWLLTRPGSPLRGSAVRASALLEAGRLDAAYRELQGCAAGPETAGLFYTLAEKFAATDRQDDARAVFRFVAARTLARSSTRKSPRREQALPMGIPRTIGRYAIEGMLGKGAMGSVFLARDMRINRSVALKIVSLEKEFDPDGLDAAKARFFQEAESAGRLHHPDIVMIYDAGEIENFSYIAMEYVQGTPLTAYTQPASQLPDARIIELGSRAAEALAYAHERHVVHRDIKPANLLYNPDRDQLKIMDFGVAQLSDIARTRTGVILGTPAYMSPEQLRGEKLRGHSDLFSLGVTLYELFTGDVPFKGEGMAGLVAALTTSQPQEIRGLRPDLPDNIQDFFDTALAKEPTDRFDDGWVMADALREITPLPAEKIRLASNAS